MELQSPIITQCLSISPHPPPPHSGVEGRYVLCEEIWDLRTFAGTVVRYCVSITGGRITYSLPYSPYSLPDTSSKWLLPQTWLVSLTNALQ